MSHTLETIFRTKIYKFHEFRRNDMAIYESIKKIRTFHNFLIWGYPCGTERVLTDQNKNIEQMA